MTPDSTVQKPYELRALETEVYAGLRWESLGRQNLKIAQLPDSFRFGEEQVALAHFAAQQLSASAKLQSARGIKPIRIADPGSGSGILTLLSSALIPGSEGLAVELMDRPFRLLEANLLVNGLQSRFKAEQADLRRWCYEGIPGVWRETFTLVIANPPYFPLGSGPERAGHTAGAQEIAAAREERYICLAEYLKVCAALLKQGGTLTLLHRPERLAESLSIMTESGLSPTVLRPLCAHADEKPNAFLLAAKKQAGTGFSWQRSFVWRRADGEYTPEAAMFYDEEILAQAQEATVGGTQV